MIFAVAFKTQGLKYSESKKSPRISEMGNPNYENIRKIIELLYRFFFLSPETVKILKKM